MTVLTPSSEASIVQHSHGLLLWRAGPADIEVLVGHMGGPYWARRDAGAWTIPKGLAEPDDASSLATAEREFREELGQAPPPASIDHPDIDLGIHRASGKQVHVVARHGTFDPDAVSGGRFTMEWPPGSRRQQEFPEVDRARWMSVTDAHTALAGNQRVFLARLVDAVGRRNDPGPCHPPQDVPDS